MSFTSSGYIVGDVNEGNILVTRKACVQFIDCDSFQVTKKDKTYYCEVGVAQFTPPEIQNSDNFRMKRTQNHDNFGLAILVFHLLFMGRHPFSGVYKGAQDMSLEKAIARYRFAFGKNAHLKSIVPPPDSVDLSIVPASYGDFLNRHLRNRFRTGRPSQRKRLVERTGLS